MMARWRRSILASHVQFGERDRGWNFVSLGHGDVDFDELFRVGRDELAPPSSRNGGQKLRLQTRLSRAP
jgi:hypothetical protein